MPRIVVLSYGLKRRTRETLDRARRYGHPIHLVAAIPTATRGLRRHRSSLVTVHPEVGRAGLEQALGPDNEIVLLLHEDVLLAPEGAEELLEAATTHRTLVVPQTNHVDVDNAAGQLPPDVVQPLGDPVEATPVRRFRSVCVAGSAARLRRLLRHRLTAATTRLTVGQGRAVQLQHVVATHLDEGRDQLLPPEGPDGRPLLVAAMIVRDEEDFLPGCLDSLDGVVDRIVICDTGSNDRTLEIAHAAGADVIEAPWRDDFAWARNQALARCRDAWWVLHIDADERARVDDVEELRRFLATSLYDRDGFDVPLENIAADGSRLGGEQLPRLFPGDGTIYVGRVHEMPRYEDGSVLPWTVTDLIEIEHHGYQEHVVEARDKYARNLALARADYDEDPTPLATLQLARSLRLSDETVDELLPLLEHLHTAMSEGRDGLNEVGHIPVYQLYAQALLRKGLPDRAWEIISEGYDRYPHSPVLRAVLGSIGIATERYDAVAGAGADHDADGEGGRPWRNPVADASASLQVALSRLAVGDHEGAGAEVEQLLAAGVPPTLGRWGEIVSVVALTRPDRVVELLLPAATSDPTGEALLAVGATFEPVDAATFAADVVTGGDAVRDEQVAAAIRLAVLADAPSALARIVDARDGHAVADIAAALDDPPPAVTRWLRDRLGSRTTQEIDTIVSSGSTIEKLDALIEDRSGEALRTLAGAVGPEEAAPLAASAVASGATSVAQVRAALTIATVARDESAAAAIVDSGPRPDAAVVDALVRRAVGRGASDVAGTIARAWFDPLPPAPMRMDGGSDRLVRVLGMHRSGTSVIAHVVRGLGADVGPDDELIPPAPDNPRGFHEHRPLVLVADRVLELLGGTWDAPPPISDEDTKDPVVHALMRGAAETVRRLLRSSGAPTLWKDPRLSLMLRLWDTVLPSVTTDVVDVHVVRRPDEVVDSLRRRQGLSEEHAARLWSRYVADTLHARPHAPLVRPEELFAAPEATAHRLAEILRLPADNATVATAVGVVHPGLQHRSVSIDSAGPWLTAAREADDALREGDVTAARTLLDDARERLTPRRAAGQPLAVLSPAHRPASVGNATAPAVMWLPAHTPTAAFEAASHGWSPAAGELGDTVHALTPSAVWIDGASDVGTVVDAVTRACPRAPIASSLEHEAADATVAMTAAPAWLADAEPVPQGPQRIGVVPTRERRPVTSVIIPVHGNWHLTDRCLTALHRNTRAPIEIIVVDDASPDDSRRLLQSDERVDALVTLDDNLGFPGAVNAGLGAATGETLCILNNDTEPQEGWLQALLRELSRDAVALVGPRSNAISGPQQVPGAPPSHGDLAALTDWAADYVAQVPARSWPANRLVGFCLLGDAALLERIGGLDEGVGRGNFEDDELCQRAAAHGELRVVDDSLVLHVGSATFGSPSAWRRAMLDGARHVDGRLHPRPAPIAVVVLADGQPEAAARTAAGLLPLGSSITIAERGDPGIHANWTAGQAAVHARSCDWSSMPCVGDVTGPASSVIIVLAGEDVQVDDPGAVRHAADQTVRAGIIGLPGTRLLTGDDRIELAWFEKTPELHLPGIRGAG